MNAYYRMVGLTVVCLALGHLIWPVFFELSVSQVKTPSMIMNTGGNNSFFNGTLFLVSFGLIPLLNFLVVKSTKTKSIKHEITSLIVIATGGIIFWQARLLLISLEANRTNIGIDPSIKFMYPINELQPQLYFCIGIFVGTIISWITLRKVNNKVPE